MVGVLALGKDNSRSVCGMGTTVLSGELQVLAVGEFADQIEIGREEIVVWKSA
jgi:uncharacterized small protein (DUF1192 family)